jgi:hypothetical protein
MSGFSFPQAILELPEAMPIQVPIPMPHWETSIPSRLVIKVKPLF